MTLNPSAGTLALLTALSFTTLGCNTKVSQCENLLSIANRVKTDMQTVGKTQDLGQVSASLEGHIKIAQALELKDKKLTGFRQRMVTLYSKIAGSSRTFVAAQKKNNQAGTASAVAAIAATDAQYSTLLAELNGYCGAK
jgi:hypothetical protein